MADLVLHASTEKELEQLKRRLAHAVLIVGPEGVGKMAIARHLAGTLLQVDALDNYPHFRVVAPDGQTISIETIRELLNFTKLKIAGEGTRRVIIIDEAHTMTTEAQNALLKLLEEPPQGTVLLLNATSTQGMLPTIRSRTQQLSMRQPTKQQLEGYFTTRGFNAQQIHNAMLLSDGLPGLMHALLHDEAHPLAQAVERARELLKLSTFERLSTVDELAKQKADCARVLFVLQHMAHAAIQQAADKSPSSLKRWQKVLNATYSASEALAKSAQPKLALTNLMLNL